MPRDNERLSKAEFHQYPLEAGPAEGVVVCGRVGEERES